MKVDAGADFARLLIRATKCFRGNKIERNPAHRRSEGRIASLAMLFLKADRPSAAVAPRR
jgi:hypothetical protein